MSFLVVSIIATVALIGSILSLIVITVIITKDKIRFAVLESQWQANELVVNNLQSASEALQSDFHRLQTIHEQTLVENTQVSKQLEHRIHTLKAQLSHQQENITLLQNEQGEDKFYARAIKLAKKGADIEEIVNECELPHAEVEILLSVYQKKHNT